MKTTYGVNRFGHITVYEIDGASRDCYLQSDWSRLDFARDLGYRGPESGAVDWFVDHEGEEFAIDDEPGTDLYGGQANYCWVRRYEFEAVPDATRRQLVRRAKALAGFTGHPCATVDFGDLIEIRPRGLAQIIFVTVGGES